MAEFGILEVDHSYKNIVNSWFPELLVKETKHTDQDTEQDIPLHQSESRQKGLHKSHSSKSEDKITTKHVTKEKTVCGVVGSKLQKSFKKAKRKSESAILPSQNGMKEPAKKKWQSVEEDSKTLTVSKKPTPQAAPASHDRIRQIQDRLSSPDLSKSARKRLRKKLNQLLLTSPAVDGRTLIGQEPSTAQAGQEQTVTSTPSKNPHKHSKRKKAQPGKIVTNNKATFQQSEASASMKTVKKPKRQISSESCESVDKEGKESTAQKTSKHKRLLVNGDTEVGVQNAQPASAKPKLAKYEDVNRANGGAGLLSDTDASQAEEGNRSSIAPKKRKKSRSKQKNIKKDHRPDHLKPAHLRTRPAVPEKSKS